MNKNLKKPIIYIALALIIIILLAIPKLKTSDSSKKPQPQRNNIVDVNVKILEDETLDNTLQLNATTLSNEETSIYSEIPGRIEKILFKEGQFVKSGQLLVKIDDSELQAQLQKAKARLDYLKNFEGRQKELFNREGISKETYENALSELKMQQAEVKLLETKIEKTNIKAPYSGKVGLRHFSKGAFINQSSEITKIYSINPIKIEFAIAQKYSNEIRKDRKIKFSIPPSDHEYTAKIYAIEPSIDPATRSIIIRAIGQNPKGEIMPGAYAEIDLPVSETTNAMMLPSQAIIQDISGAKAYVYQSGKAIAKNVETGIRTSDEIQITDGLSIGDTVICTGIIQLRGGQDVKISGVIK